MAWIDLVTGTMRPHNDLDVAILRDDLQLLAQTLDGWDLHLVDDGQLLPWRAGDPLSDAVHQLWAREGPDEPWRFEILLEDHGEGQWCYRRNPSVRLPIDEFGDRTDDGIPHVAAHVQLLYKSQQPRPRDTYDLTRTIDHLTDHDQTWLAMAIATRNGSHPWIQTLGHLSIEAAAPPDDQASRTVIAEPPSQRSGVHTPLTNPATQP